MIAILFTLLMVSPFNLQSKRQLLLFADFESNPKLTQQLSILNQDAPGLKERDVEFKVYYANKNIRLFKTNNIKAPFTVILVGKDGSNKLISTAPLTLSKLFNTIDAMPMRQQEMKQP